MNTLSALGEEFEHMRKRVIVFKGDHPDGPGAGAYYALRANAMESSKTLERNWRRLLGARGRAR